MKAFKKIDKSRLIAIHGEKILVLQKTGKKKKYTLAGGVKKKKETIISSLLREVFEEIGLKLCAEEITYFLSKKNSSNKHKTETNKHYFITEKHINNIQILEPHKFKKSLWKPWYDTLKYLDKEDRTAIILYFDQYRISNESTKII